MGALRSHDARDRGVDRGSDQQQIQSRLIPRVLPSAGSFELAGRYSPCHLVGGDYYDAVRLGESDLLITMADVSGKGTGAALLTANLQAILRFVESPERSPETVAAAINAHLLRHTAHARFVTMVLAVLDLSTHRLRYVNAGHNPPLGVTLSGETLRLEATGPPLGMLDAATYECAEVDFPVGAALVFYTDGLTERMDPSEDMYGEDRLLAVLRQTADEPAERIGDAIVQDAQRFARGAQPNDDTALLVVRSL